MNFNQFQLDEAVWILYYFYFKKSQNNYAIPSALTCEMIAVKAIIRNRRDELENLKDNIVELVRVIFAHQSCLVHFLLLLQHTKRTTTGRVMISDPVRCGNEMNTFDDYWPIF